ncbi:MAG: peptide chain release factor N(5)-glutamine methyltransferase [Treponema sp.]|nr:peptide chain release factor N(5)-glutamine methyltransferase [Treponema sp.]
MLIREALAQGSADLKYAGMQSPGLDASLLLAHVLNTTRTAIIAAGPEKLSEKNCALYCELIERRAGGECVAYITGKKEFRRLEFFVNKFVLVPRPDTETLVEAAAGLIPVKRREEINVLDLCTGSGAAAISLKYEMPELEVSAADICANALEVAKQNADKLLGKNKINFFQGDLFCALVKSPFPVQYSLIISNPPYIPSGEIQSLSLEVQNEPLLALDGGEDGLDIIRKIIKEAPKYLRHKGYLLLEADSRQMDMISVLLEKNGFNDIQLFKDLGGSNRVIGGKNEI